MHAVGQSRPCVLAAADFFALSAAELGGAMVGALLVWIHHLPHFKTMPEPPGIGIHDPLLRSRDDLPRNALRCASNCPPG